MTKNSLDRIISDSNSITELIKNKNWMNSINDLWNIISELQILFNENIRETSIHPSVKIPKSCIIIEPVIIEENVKILPGTIIEGPSFIGKKSLIGPNAYIRKYSFLEKNVNIGHCTEIILSILLDGVKMRHFGFVGRSIIGRNCLLAAGFTTSVIRLDGNSIKIDEYQSDRIGAIVGDYCKFGVGVKVMPGKKIGENSFIWPNVIINENIPNGSEVKLYQKNEIHKRNGI